MLDWRMMWIKATKMQLAIKKNNNFFLWRTFQREYNSFCSGCVKYTRTLISSSLTICQKYPAKLPVSKIFQRPSRWKSRLLNMICKDLSCPGLSLLTSSNLLLATCLPVSPHSSCFSLCPYHPPPITHRHTLLVLTPQNFWQLLEPHSSTLLLYLSSWGSTCLECHYLPLVNSSFKNYL